MSTLDEKIIHCENLLVVVHTYFEAKYRWFVVKEWLIIKFRDDFFAQFRDPHPATLMFKQKVRMASYTTVCLIYLKTQYKSELPEKATFSDVIWDIFSQNSVKKFLQPTLARLKNPECLPSQRGNNSLMFCLADRSASKSPSSLAVVIKLTCAS